MIIRDILILREREVLTSPPTKIVADAISMMMQAGVGSLLILQDGVMVGLLTERDVLRGIHDYGAKGLAQPVSSMMVTEPIIGNPEDSVDYVRGVMTEHRITHLPVMDGQQKLLGVISYHDVAKACLNAVDFENSLLKRYIKHWPEA
jgi:CBS domain-containing protein